jgi:hypothetical protein
MREPGEALLACLDLALCYGDQLVVICRRYHRHLVIVRLGLGHGRQADGEAGTHARLTRDNDLAAHQSTQVLAERQSEAGAAVLGGDAGIGLRELVE